MASFALDRSTINAIAFNFAEKLRIKHTFPTEKSRNWMALV